MSAADSAAADTSSAAAGAGFLSTLLETVGMGSGAASAAAAAAAAAAASAPLETNAQLALAFLKTHVLHWSGIGALLLVLLFQGSTDFTEQITVGKYPSYREYQRRTSKLVPWFSGGSLKED